MTDIPRTRLGTSDTPGDICKGAFALFPAAGAARAGASFARKDKTFFSANPHLGVLRLQSAATMTFLAGVCGPSYAVRYEVEGEASGDSLTLSVLDDSVAAGFFAGCKVTFGIPVRLDAWRFGWHTVFNLSPKIEIDMLNLLFELIKKLMGGKPGPDRDGETQVENDVQVDAEKPADKEKGYSVKSLAMYDFATGSLAADGRFSARPSMDFPIDLVPYITGLNGIKAALEKWWGGLFFGPVISLIIPVTVDIEEVRLDDRVYADPKVANGTLTATASGGAAPAAPKEIGMTLAHRPGFDLGLSFGASIWVCKLFKLGGSLPRLELAKLMGIDVSVGPFDNDLANRIGRRTVAAADGEPVGRLAREPLEVVLEPRPAPA